MNCLLCVRTPYGYRLSVIGYRLTIRSLCGRTYALPMVVHSDSLPYGLPTVVHTHSLRSPVVRMFHSDDEYALPYGLPTVVGCENATLSCHHLRCADLLMKKLVERSADALLGFTAEARRRRRGRKE